MANIPIIGKVTVGGAAKDITGGYVNIGGVWKPIVKTYVNVNGVWKSAWKNLSRLPDGYTEIEYIQSSGAQYINTGYMPNNTTGVFLDAQIMNNQVANTAGLYVMYGASGNVNFAAIYTPDASRWYQVRNRRQAFFSESCNRLERFTLDVKAAGATIIIGDITETVVPNVGTHQSNNNMFLFCDGFQSEPQYYVSMKMFACKIFDNSVLIRDYVPCVNPSGEVGLFELVSGIFCPNNGAGTFTAGAEV